MGKIDKLEEQLNKSLEEFKAEMKNKIEDSKNDTLTGDDLESITRETYYTLNEFKKYIIEYLKEAGKY